MDVDDPVTNGCRCDVLGRHVILYSHGHDRSVGAFQRLGRDTFRKKSTPTETAFYQLRSVFATPDVAASVTHMNHDDRPRAFPVVNVCALGGSPALISSLSKEGVMGQHEANGSPDARARRSRPAKARRLTWFGTRVRRHNTVAIACVESTLLIEENGEPRTLKLRSATDPPHPMQQGAKSTQYTPLLLGNIKNAFRPKRRRVTRSTQAGHKAPHQTLNRIRTNKSTINNKQAIKSH
ncbi:MAG TPA: hypothetical protein VM580_18950 [Labilithrix sp.]|nr:hypothetical protein [Labilithrix sp.]